MAIVLTHESTLTDQSTALKRETKILDKLAIAELALGAALALGGAVWYALERKASALIAGAILLALGFSHRLKQRENSANTGKIDHGRSGEAFVTKLLVEQLPDDCYILNDIDVNDGIQNAQNDHLVVSPYGLFVVETKAYAGRLEGTEADEKLTQTKRVKGREVTQKLTNPIRQNEYHVEVLKRFLEQNRIAIASEDIHAYVAMTDKRTTWSIEGAGARIDYAWIVARKMRDTMKARKYSNDVLAKFLAALKVAAPPALSA